MPDRTYDLIIIGGGILGTFHAYHALAKGLKVLLLEKDPRPQGATVRNFGQIVPSGMDARWQKYGRRSLEIYQEIQQQFDITVRQNGSVYLASNPEELQLLEELATINQANAYTSQLLSKQSCLDAYPGLRSDYCVGGLFFPDEITLEPEVAVHRILDFLQTEIGLQYQANTAIKEVSIGANKVEVKSTYGETFKAEKVLLCNGSEFQLLFPEIFAKSDMQWVKLQMLRTAPQASQKIPGSILTGLSIRRYESFRECPSYASIKSKENAESFARKWGVHILFKQATDGSVIVGDSHEYADADKPGDLDFLLKEEINQFMIAEAQKIFDLENWNISQRWYGLYTQCKNSDLFQYNIEDRIHILTGIGGKGMTGSAGFAEENIERIMQT